MGSIVFWKDGIMGGPLERGHLNHMVCQVFPSEQPYCLDKTVSPSFACCRKKGHDGVHVCNSTPHAWAVWGEPSANDFRLVENYKNGTD